MQCGQVHCVAACHARQQVLLAHGTAARIACMVTQAACLPALVPAALRVSTRAALLPALSALATQWHQLMAQVSSAAATIAVAAAAAVPLLLPRLAAWFSNGIVPSLFAFTATATALPSLSFCAADSCVPCPAGSTTSDFITCVACPPGEYEAGGSCTACDAGTYRTGDATPENNECKNIPAGFREKTVAEGADARTQIVPCAVGTFSAWDAAGTTRTPADPLVCQVCDLNTYAPRTGEWSLPRRWLAV